MAKDDLDQWLARTAAKAGSPAAPARTGESLSDLWSPEDETTPATAPIDSSWPIRTGSYA